MKVYIDKFNINILPDIIEILSDYNINSITYIQLYTDEGIYEINNKKIYLLEPIDKDIINYDKYFKNFNLIVDQSYFNKEETTSINGNIHYSNQIKKNIYKINSEHKLKLIIECILLDNIYKPNDIYFEYDDDKNINELFIKQEIIEFLSFLN
jgi:hypothetical protein